MGGREGGGRGGREEVGGWMGAYPKRHILQMLTLVSLSGGIMADFVLFCVFRVFCLNMYCFVIRKTNYHIF